MVSNALINSSVSSDVYRVRLWLGTEKVTSHYLNQWWFSTSKTAQNDIPQKFCENQNVFIQETIIQISPAG